MEQRPAGDGRDRDDESSAAHRALLAAIVESSDDAIVSEGLDGTITSWNRGAERMYGYKATEIVGKPVSLLAHPDHADEMSDILERIRRGERVEHYETIRARKDRSAIAVSLTVSPIYDHRGAVVGASSIARDITERAISDLTNLFASTEIATIFLDRDLRIVRLTPAASALLHLLDDDVGRSLAELSPRFEGEDLVADARESLRESEERLRLLVEGVKDYALITLAPDGTVATWNAGAERLKGFRAEEIVGQHFSRFYPEEDVQAGKPQQQLEVAAAEGRLEQEGWRLRKDGSRFWANVIITAVRDEAGRLRGFAKVTRDFTERKRAEDALRESEARANRQLREIETIYRSAGTGLCVLDRELRYVRINERLAEMNGVPAEAHLGRTVREVVPAVAEQAEALAHRVLETGEAVTNIELTGTTPAQPGVIRAWVEHWLPLKDEAGQIIGINIAADEITERSRMADALRASEERLKRAQAIAHLGAWELDIASNKLVWSDEIYRIFGLPPQEFGATYEAFLEAVHPDDRAAVDAAYSGSLREGKDSYEIEHRVVRKSGEVRVVQEKCEHHRDASGRVVRSVGMVHDVTERRQAELERERLLAEVQRRAAELDATFESLADGLVVVDTEARISRFNANAARILGVTREFFEKSMSARIEEADARTASGGRFEEEQTISMRALRGETVHGEIRRARRGDGKDIWLSGNGAPILVGGKIAGAVLTFTDVTDRLQAEEDLKRSREGLSRLAEASRRVMRETDLEAMFQSVSVSALELTRARVAVSGHGYVSGQFVIGGAARAPGMPDCPPGNVFAIEHGGVYMELLEGSADTIRLTDAELRAHPRWWGLPEEHVPMRGLLGVRLVDREGRTNGMILVTDKEQGDFTAEDESLLRQLGTLASLAWQHVSARIALEEADRSKTQFLAVLSHELRNPLAPIRNSLYVLDRAVPGGEQARRAKTVIDRQVAQMTRLVDDLLDVTRISHGKIQLQRESLDLVDVVRREVEDQRPLFAANRLDLQVAIPDERILIHGDRTRVAQVVGNLLGNAAKFTPPGGTVAVSVEANAELGQAVARVRDTGAGIAPEMLPRIFEPFTQADTTLDRSKGGLGLGLALVKGIMDLHGGTASVTSAGLGKGAELTVRFPLEAGVVPTTAPVRGAPNQGAGRRVLVIEDNVDAAQSLREVLELDDHTVEVAYSGVDGIEQARAFRPEVVLCDIGLPGIDGYDVARAMRADEALQSIFLVALSGYALPEDVAKAKAAGFDRHIAKPPSLEKLTEVLASAPSTEGASRDNI